MTTTEEGVPRPDHAAGVLAAARERRRVADAAEADLLQLAVDWASMHSADSVTATAPATHPLRGFWQTDIAVAGPGAPTVAEFAVPEFSTAIALSHDAGRHYLGEALELAHRLPRLWTRVTTGDLPAWKARRIARETVRLSPDAAAYVDRHLAPLAHKVRPVQIDRLVAEAIGRYMPEEVERVAAQSWDNRHVTLHDQLVSFTGTMHLEADLDIADALDLEAAVALGAELRAAWGSRELLDVRRAQAVGDLARHQPLLDLEHGDGPRAAVKPRQVVIYVHLSEVAVLGDDPVAHLERGNGLVAVEQVRTWCGNPDTQVVVRPVLDLAACDDVDSDVAPDHLAERVAVRDRTCVFPWCTRPARSCHPADPHDHPCDNDHVHPHSRDGATCTCNLAPLCRRHHRLKTHAPWTYVVLHPGTFLWTSPHGYQLLRDLEGTLDVSRDRPRAPDR